jgi:DNA polymerase elongation subunit (family B)
MTEFYTNVLSVGNNILYRGVKNGRRVRMKIAYKPTLYLPAKKETKFKNLHGEYLEPMQFEGIREARDFAKRYEDVGNFKIYGNLRYEYAYIADNQKGMVDWDQDQISIAAIDIETYSAEGFPDPYRAEHPITAICIRYINGPTLVYGCGDYNNTNEDVTYIKCKDEHSLCKRFLADWKENCPDVLTGWNIKFFDIPYIFNRFTKLLGEDETKDLSPWRLINQRKVMAMGKENIAYEILGVATYDYIELYRW